MQNQVTAKVLVPRRACCVHGGRGHGLFATSASRTSGASFSPPTLPVLLFPSCLLPYPTRVLGASVRSPSAAPTAAGCAVVSSHVGKGTPHGCDEPPVLPALMRAFPPTNTRVFHDGHVGEKRRAAFPN